MLEVGTHMDFGDRSGPLVWEIEVCARSIFDLL